LEEVGQSFAVTRERIPQIDRLAPAAVSLSELGPDRVDGCALNSFWNEFVRSGGRA
jgi:hypothetical protein